MVDSEEYTDFSSQFLDSILEVEMKEDDIEIDIPKNEETIVSSRKLPPIPTFDLQMQTFNYRNAGNSLLIPKEIPNTTLKIPVPEANSVVVTSGNKCLAAVSENVKEVLPVQMYPVNTTENNFLSSCVAPKLKTNIIPSVDVNSSSYTDKILMTKFLKKLFKPEYTKHVFVQKDNPNDALKLKKEEMDFYKACFKG